MGAIKVKWEQTEKQAIAWNYLLDKTTNEIVFGGGAGGAKSFTGCAFLICMCGMYPGTRWLMGRKRLKRLKETTLRTFFEVCKKWGLKAGEDYRYNAQDGIITFANESEILLADLMHQPSDPEYEELGSLELTGAFIDEVGQITYKCWSVVNSRIRFRLDEYGLVPKCFGSCNPTKKWVYSEFYKPNKENKLSNEKAFIKALAIDNPFISKHYIKQLERIKDVATRERLLNGNWEYDDDPAVLFDFETINDLFSNAPQEGKKELFLSGDVARKGRDRMPVFLWEGLHIKKVFIIPPEIKRDTQKAKQYIIDKANYYGVRKSHIVLDEDGVGGGVVDSIPGCVGFLNGGSPILTESDKRRRARGEYYTNFGNLKTQCYFKFAELAEAGEISIAENAFDDVDDREKFIEELGQVKQRDIDKDGRIYLLEKEKVKANLGRSPDLSDGAMMRMIFYLKPRHGVVVSDV